MVIIIHPVKSLVEHNTSQPPKQYKVVYLLLHTNVLLLTG